MSDYANLKAAIQQVIKTNGNNEITGAILQQTLLSMINSLVVGYQYVGVAEPSTNPGTPDQKVFYLASQKGVYSNFDAQEILKEGVYLFAYDTSWHFYTIVTKDVTTENAFYEFEIKDDSGNVILGIQNGHIITRNFNSSLINHPIEIIDTPFDFTLQDDLGNVVFAIINGLPYTRNFDPRQMQSSGYDVTLSGRYLIRENTTVDNSGNYTTLANSYASNKIGIKNAKKIILFNNVNVCLFYADNSVEILRNSLYYDINGAIAMVLFGTAPDVGFSIGYASEKDVDLSDYPIYYRIPVDQNRINLSGSDSQSLTDNYQYPMAVCYFAKNRFSKKTILLFQGYGKALTVDGWLSTSTGFTDFIAELQNDNFNVVCVEGGRPVTTSDIYRSDIGGYVMPSLGNPLIMAAMNKAHNFAVAQFGLNEDAAIVGCSQGGIGALNYNFLYGNIKAIVLCGGLAQLQLDGWTRQDSAVRAYFNEWYGITQYDAAAVRGYDPFVKIISLSATPFLFNFPPLKGIYGGSDGTAPAGNFQPYITAVNNANGIAFLHTISEGTHATIAGLTDVNARKEARIWLNRFV